jgi:hypothetical protein
MAIPPLLDRRRLLLALAPAATVVLPGGIEAGVPEFIDRQMELPYGHGAYFYLKGPFLKDAPPTLGYQLRCTLVRFTGCEFLRRIRRCRRLMASSSPAPHEIS